MHIVRRPKEWQVSWTTISYRWVKILCALLLLAAAFVLYLIFGARILALIESVSIRGDGVTIEHQKPFPSPMTIDELEGEVRIMHAGAPSWVSPKKGEAISPGDVLQTDEDGAAVLAIPEVIRLDIAPDSVVVLASATPTEHGVKVAARLASGSLEFVADQVPRGAEPQLFLADATFIPREQTSGRAWASSRAGSYSLVLLNGSGTLNRDLQGVELKPFDRATLNAEEGDFHFRSELPPPVLLVPEDGTQTMAANCSSPLDFSWDKVDAAVAYRFRVASTRFFTEPIVEKVLSSRSLQLQLPEGNYFWQVEGIQAGRKLSLASAPRQFQRICSQRFGGRAPVTGSP